MKRFLTSLALLLTFSVSAQTFQVATQIVASPDCKLKFLNKIDSQIYEVNSVDMTWQYLTTTTIKIKDYDNEVTIYKNNMTSPIFANIPAFLDSVQGACMGGSGGGGGVQSIVPGTNITVDDTDPQNPIVSSTGGGGGAGDLESVLLNGNVANNGIILSDSAWNFTEIYPSFMMIGDSNVYSTVSTGYINNYSHGFPFATQSNLTYDELSFQWGDAYDNIKRGEENGGQNTHYLQDKTGTIAHLDDFIPITGTTEDNPVTGTVVFDVKYDSIEDEPGLAILVLNNNGEPALFFENGEESGLISVVDTASEKALLINKNTITHVGFNEGVPTYKTGLVFLENSLVVGATDSNFTGIYGSDYWGANYVPNSLVQLQYITDLLSGKILIPEPPGSGNYILKSVDGVVSWIAE